MSKQESNKKFQTIGAFYLVFAVIFLIAGMGIFENASFNSIYIFQYFGYTLLIFGGWEGLILIFISIITLFSFKIKKSLIFGIIGCVLIGINFILIIVDYSMRIAIGYIATFVAPFYITLIAWIILCFINGIIYILKSRLEIPISKEEKPVEVVPPEKVPEGMKYCSSCGEKIKKEATYCEFCGSEQ